MALCSPHQEEKQQPKGPEPQNKQDSCAGVFLKSRQEDSSSLEAAEWEEVTG